jgi:hypothetical protein
MNQFVQIFNTIVLETGLTEFQVLSIVLFVAIVLIVAKK